MKKEKYFMKSYGGDKYFTVDKTLYEKRCKHNKWEELYGYSGACFFVSCLVSIVSAIVFDENIHLNIWVAVAIFFGILIPIWTATITFYCIVEYKLKLYDWENDFENSDEFKKQFKQYTKRDKQLKLKKSEEKAKNLIEAYDILDDKNMSKEDKINLLKEYINKENNK